MGAQVPVGVRRTVLTTDWGWFREQAHTRHLAVYTLRGAPPAAVPPLMPRCVVVPAPWYEEHGRAAAGQPVEVQVSALRRMRTEASSNLARFDEARASGQVLHILAMKDHRPPHERDGVHVGGHPGTLVQAWVDPYWYCSATSLDPESLLADRVVFVDPPGKAEKDASASPPAGWGAYRQVVDTVRARIGSGELAAGSALPSEAALGREFGVSRSTARRALVELEKLGLVGSSPAGGRVVSAGAPRLALAEQSALPGYLNVSADLRERIIRGEFAAGQALPGESRLAQEYGVSVGTIRRALAEVDASGLVDTVPRRGRVVKPAQEG
ncbi:winged helix-turn-helix domain-containing protein [Nocardiopsis dassonvillei]|uniref:winged helix-turn-helix domain-containing protein n=1 Tax=Nocardiopsis dassonvillei TaxID=2014 RepID=UPI00200FBB5E|nr:winged helix-turn-helix domain-containing protein [Nocardiopsis dassonvillei]MCK9874124.1 winged helix-turn-helix domain-containing protein [Nocardiopsis dassonvillei]